MDPLRMKRYGDKVELIKESLLLFKPFTDDELHNRGVLYSIQISIEGIVDLIAMLLVDNNIKVQEDRVNISKIIEIMNWEPSMADQLIFANGLRNVIIHQYNGIQRNLIENSILQLQNDLENWIDYIQEAIMQLEDN